jgi:cell shape-determining protein MreC
MKRLPHEVLTDWLQGLISKLPDGRVAHFLELVVLYFNNLTDALLGRTQGFVTAMYAAVDGVSKQVLELEQENDELRKALLSQLESKKKAAKKPKARTKKQ